jgi:hypothetical protein
MEQGNDTTLHEYVNWMIETAEKLRAGEMSILCEELHYAPDWGVSIKIKKVSPAKKRRRNRERGAC